LEPKKLLDAVLTGALAIAPSVQIVSVQIESAESARAGRRDDESGDDSHTHDEPQEHVSPATAVAAIMPPATNSVPFGWEAITQVAQNRRPLRHIQTEVFDVPLPMRADDGAIFGGIQ
jgi:hypothetical protein